MMPTMIQSTQWHSHRNNTISYPMRHIRQYIKTHFQAQSSRAEADISHSCGAHTHRRQRQSSWYDNFHKIQNAQSETQCKNSQCSNETNGFYKNMPPKSCHTRVVVSVKYCGQVLPRCDGRSVAVVCIKNFIYMHIIRGTPRICITNCSKNKHQSLETEKEGCHRDHHLCNIWIRNNNN